MKYVFGPVPSRRLGQSLGIDPIPIKVCNWNCVYCQLGRTIPVTNTRQAFFPREDIAAEAHTALAVHHPIDWVTFVGSGETTLHSELGWLIRQVKQYTELPVAVITNGSLLYLPEVRTELSAADAVLPTLDAGNPELYRKINRPHPKATFERLVNGLIAFRQMYPGKLWVEVMLVEGLNDTEEALEQITGWLKRIQPDEIHILLPTRPPCETWVRPPGSESIERAQRILGRLARVIPPATGAFELNDSDEIVDAILSIITRHPMREEELVTTLERFSPAQVGQHLEALLTCGRAQVVERLGTRFWSAAPSVFPDPQQSEKTRQ